MQYSHRSVFFLVGILQLVRSVHIEQRYNKQECGPYGFRCLNDKMFEICAEFKRSDDSSYYGEEKLYPPIGSKALCPEGRECDKENPLYCTLDREERYEHFKRKHKKCDEQQTTTPPPSCDKDKDKDADDGDDDDEGSSGGDQESCDKKQPAVVFDESQQKSSTGTGSRAEQVPCDTDTESQKAEAPTYEIHSQGGEGGKGGGCSKHTHKQDSEVSDDSSRQAARASQESSCSDDRSQGDDTTPIIVIDETNNLPQGAEDSQNADNSNFNMFVGDVPDMTSTQPSEPSNNQLGGDYQCSRAGNFPDPKDCKKYFFCDINNKGDGYVPSHKSCRCGEVFNNALRECIPIENLHADTKRWLELPAFKCVTCGEFPDPNDCHKYYVCEREFDDCGRYLKQLKMTHKCCPGGMKFDKILKNCVCTDRDGYNEDKRETNKESKRCCDDDECPSPPKCVVVIPTSAPPEPCGSCGGDDDYEDGPHVPGQSQPDDDDEDEPECPEVSCSSHPGISLPKPHHFNCHGAGKFVDPYNCTTFFVCHPKRAESGFDKLRFSCPSGKVFDQASQRCVPSNTSEHEGARSNCNRGVHD